MNFFEEKNHGRRLFRRKSSEHPQGEAGGEAEIFLKTLLKFFRLCVYKGVYIFEKRKKEKI
ncbi:MAG: hypothetical protein LUG66_11365 [Clostridiales bacterium]|nr:hypothetical protein [Clostridiales bacterium]